MKLVGSALYLASAFAVGLGAQGGTIKTTTETRNTKATVERKIEIKEGKDTKTTGLRPDVSRNRASAVV